MKCKRWIQLISTAIFGILVSSHAAASTPPTDNGTTTSLSAMLTKVTPAVVNITVMGETRGYAPVNPRNKNQQQDNDDEGAPAGKNGGVAPYSRQFEEMGSGVIIDPKNGLVVTNSHVVMDQKIIIVTLSDGRRFKAKLIGTDKPSDIAVLQIHADNLTGIAFANSDLLKVGDFVAAIGNPFGLAQTVTSGVISALNRSVGIEGYENFIQTDASINPGNSGGALVNLNGELVGVNTALIGPISGNVGIGLSIPSNMVKAVANQLIKYGKVQRGVLGVMVQDLTPALADAFNLSGKKGALITNVIHGSPAEKAGLQPQDIIQRINGIEVTSAGQVRNLVGLLPVNAKAPIVVIRKDKTMNMEATIVNPETLKLASPDLSSFMDGVRLTSYDQFIPDFGTIKGVGVLDVIETSDAWIGGLRPGDVILEANGQAVANIDQLLAVAKTNANRLLLKVGRAQGIIFLVINRF